MSKLHIHIHPQSYAAERLSQGTSDGANSETPSMSLPPNVTHQTIQEIARDRRETARPLIHGQAEERTEKTQNPCRNDVSDRGVLVGFVGLVEFSLGR